jgi:hypothetical protein
VTFLDCSPDEKLKKTLQEKNIEIVIYDHHPHSAFPDPNDHKYPLKTATSIIMEQVGGQLKEKFSLTDEKIRELITWSKRADFATGGDGMNFLNITREMNLKYSDSQVQQWTEDVILASFSDLKETELEEGRNFFLKTLNEFLKNAKAAKTLLQGFLARATKTETCQDTMNIINRTAAMLKKFRADQTKAWLLMALLAIEERQKRFQEALTDVKEKATIVVSGQSVIIMAISDNLEFVSAARAYAAKKIRGKKPIVVKINLDNKGFQIFSNGFNDLREVAKALRVEILSARGMPIPNDWRILQEDGTLPGTEPLYYHRAGYSVIMWGSLTRPDVMPVDITQEQLQKVIMTVLDREFMPQECKESKDCLKYECWLFKYRLQRCSQCKAQKQPQNRESNGFVNSVNSLITVRTEK